jgi:hypothetical protein
MRFPRFLVLFLALVPLAARTSIAQRAALANQFLTPISVFNHDSAFSQSPAPVNEAQAMRELDELARLKKAGMHSDFAMMDASWFVPASAYRTLRASDWPYGAGEWMARCAAIGVRPGLRIDGNMAPMQSNMSQLPPQWHNSLDGDGRSLSLFEGGFLPDVMAAMQSWYDRGVRLFVFDSVDLSATTPASAAALGQSEIANRNAAALRRAFEAFGARNRDAVLVITLKPGINERQAGLAQAAISGEANSMAHEPNRFGAFALVSAGVARPQAAPQANLWRSIDIENDESVRRLEQSGLSLAEIESNGFTASGSADSGMHAWKGAFLLSLARGGWVNAMHGDLALISDDDARWMGRAQQLFFALQQEGRLHSFGAAAGSSQPYGFAGSTARGSVYVVVNPSESIAEVALPAAGRGQDRSGRVLFEDAGFTPRLNGNTVTLGPGQMAMVGFGAYTASEYRFGVQQDVIIPHSVEQVDADFHSTDAGALEASIDPPVSGVVRLVVRPRAGQARKDSAQRDSARKDSARSDSAGADQDFTLVATQYGRPIPVRLDDSSKLGDGQGWAVGEIDVNDLTPGVPLVVQVHSSDSDMASLEADAYAVEY